MKLIVLDRDGVINEESANYIRSPDEWTPLPGSIDAVGRLCTAGFTVAVATNQSGVGRGLFDTDALHRIHTRMHDELAAAGARIAALVYCPHRPEDRCTCRKPKPGLLLELAQRLGVSMEDVPVVGDSARDLEAAIAVKARPILVLTGNGASTAPAWSEKVEVYADLAAVADELLLRQTVR